MQTLRVLNTKASQDVGLLYLMDMPGEKFILSEEGVEVTPAPGTNDRKARVYALAFCLLYVQVY